MTTVRIDDSPRMNILGLFLAASLERNLVERALPCRLRGAMTIDADGMRATVRFEADGAVVTRSGDDVRVVLRAPLWRFVEALVRPGLGRFLKVKWSGNPIFALRAMRYLAP